MVHHTHIIHFMQFVAEFWDLYASLGLKWTSLKIQSSSDFVGHLMEKWNVWGLQALEQKNKQAEPLTIAEEEQLLVNELLGERSPQVLLDCFYVECTLPLGVVKSIEL